MNARRLLAIVCLSGLVSCNGRTPPDVPVSDGSASSAPTMPQGHPQIESATALPEVGDSVGRFLAWDDPPAWESVPPSSTMRRAQYWVDGTAGRGECVVYYFGPGQGGEPMPNALRWADQFLQPDGTSSREQLVTKATSVNGIAVTWVDVSGTYLGSMGPTGPETLHQEGYQLIGAIAQGPDAFWFFKFIGPAATVSENRASLESMIATLEISD